ncbi:clathrin coat assembly protein AP180 [Pyrus ussuriensis x Pyrus communis]|uniref:Clathrin coat assembly protein AP180 n=1 Tax=Pyrus ussuriensis x Pyrus communis TaxID=2448454 RepID=A0A5N5G5J6_9ROSA|nr:clathrin coat assembly protein AP180 [Pyrus ussuriensis x Pyrus communis]
MPSKLNKAIGAVKDQTSISLPKVYNNNSANLEVTFLKATSHDVSYASSCAQATAKRIGKTRNWIVALKSLMLVLRIFQDGDPYFPIEVLHAMKRGAKILNLSNFRDDSNSCPWDYTAFVRTFALYLDERLDCFLTGKLQRRFTYQRDQEFNNNRRSRQSNEPVVRNMKPAKLLDRAIDATPTGAAKTNRLVLISLYAIVQETYDLYRDISDGLALLLDSFFHLQYQSCVNVFHACVKASKQFEELASFYALCKSLGVGRTSEYPSVQKISEELLETLQEFLKDQASFPGRSPLTHLQIGSDQMAAEEGEDKGLSFEPDEFASSEQFEASERGSAFGSACTSLEDLMTRLYNSEEQPNKTPENESIRRANRNGSTQSLPAEVNRPQPASFEFGLVSFDDWPPQRDQIKKQEKRVNEIFEVGNQEGSEQGWELVLFESASNQPPLQASSPLPASANNLFDSSNFDSLFQQSSVPQHQYNPFLQDTIPIESFATSSSSNTATSNGFGNFGDDLFSFPTTSQTPAPTFCMQNSNGGTIAPTFRTQNTNITTTVSTLHAHTTNNTTMAPPFGAPSPKGSTISPTLWSQHTSKSTMSPTFGAPSPEGSTISPTLWSQHTNESKMAPTFGAWSMNEATTAPTFCARSLVELAVAPTFSEQSINDTKTALPACTQSPKEKTAATPTFWARDTNEGAYAPTFCAVTHYNECVTPTFRAENRNDTIVAPTFRGETRNDTIVAPALHTDDANEFLAAPTFLARSGNGWGTIENDPFTTFSNVRSSSEPMCNGLMNRESPLHQQRLWLE